MKNGWYKIVYDQNMPTDFWTPSNEICFVEVRGTDDNPEYWNRKKWDLNKKEVIDVGFYSVDRGSFLQYVKFIPIDFGVEENPKDERIDKIFWKEEKFNELA